METIILMLPYPPSNNKRLLLGKGGRMVKTEAARSYQERVGWIARKAVSEPRTERLTVVVTVYPPRGIGQDLDNLPKNIFDALNGVAWKDDSQVWFFSVERRQSVRGGRIAVVIEDYDQEEPSG